MPIASTDQLYQLIKSLEKSEKRNFKLYARRLGSNKNPYFIQLFDIMDKMKIYDEELLQKKLHKEGKEKIVNVKRHLYSQILNSLRLIHSNKDISIQIREQLDHSQILYGKGLYLQSLKILDRARTLAEKSNQDLLLFEILEFGKLIESRHITRSRQVPNKVESLIEQSSMIKAIVSNMSDLKNLNLMIHGMYIKKGHVKNEMDTALVRDYFNSNLLVVNKKTSGFLEEVYLNQAYVWYYYTLLDFTNCKKYAQKWVDLFEVKPVMKTKDPDLYMRGLHYLLTTLFYLKDKDSFRKYIRFFNELNSTQSRYWNATSQLVYFIYGINARINAHFIKGQFLEVCNIEKDIIKYMKEFHFNLDRHREITFYYKLAWAFLAVNNPTKAIDYLNKIQNVEKNKLRNEIICYSKLLMLMAHYQLGNNILVENLLPTTSRYFKVNKETNPVQLSCMKFLRRVCTSGHNVKESAEVLIHELNKYIAHKFHKRVFIYFNFVEWAHSIKDGNTIAEFVSQEYSDYLDTKFYQ